MNWGFGFLVDTGKAARFCEVGYEGGVRICSDRVFSCCDLGQYGA